VRAKTSVTAANVQPDERQKRALQAASRQYLALAQEFLRKPPPFVIAVGGLSGSGKSTLARALAPSIGPAPGALILRSDVIRKRLLGVAPLTRLGPEGYSPAMSRHVYQTLADRALATVKAGHTAIVDAVYGDVGDRDAIASIAHQAGVPFIGLWIDGPAPVLASRLQGRVMDASDAPPDVLRRQLLSPVGRLDWYRLDGSRDAEWVRQSAEAQYRECQRQLVEP
jgi:predicted kinase